MGQIHTRVTGTAIELADGREFLLVDIAIDCPACGTYTLQVAGHHLRAIRDGLIELIDAFPALTGTDPKVHERLRYAGTVPDDPTKN